MTTRDGSDAMLKTKLPIGYLLLETNLRNSQPMLCSSRTKSNPPNRHREQGNPEQLPPGWSRQRRTQTTSHSRTGITMLKPELSRLKGAPSTCVCSDGYRSEKAIMGRQCTRNLGLPRMYVLERTQSHGKARHHSKGIRRVRLYWLLTAMVNPDNKPQMTGEDHADT